MRLEILLICQWKRRFLVCGKILTIKMWKKLWWLHWFFPFYNKKCLFNGNSNASPKLYNLLWIHFFLSLDSLLCQLHKSFCNSFNKSLKKVKCTFPKMLHHKQINEINGYNLQTKKERLRTTTTTASDVVYKCLLSKKNEFAMKMTFYIYNNDASHMPSL